MPDISISADQRERLQWVQDRLGEDIAYGHVRPCDALEYLLDHFDDTGEPVDTAATTAIDEATAYATQTFENGTSEPTDDTDRGEDAGAESNGADDSDDSDDPETTLNSMMSLLENNTDVWRESSGGEEKYEVDLPDGSTERARTKDDVRALLFKHYR